MQQLWRLQKSITLIIFSLMASMKSICNNKFKQIAEILEREKNFNTRIDKY